MIMGWVFAPLRGGARADPQKHSYRWASSSMENGIIPFNGRFTIESPRGGHKTFQIRTAKGGNLKGKRILSIFFGRENTDDRQYEGFAFVNDDRIAIWGKKNDQTHQMYVRMLTDLVAKGESSELYAMGYRLLMEKKCRVCNRTLTNPESIKSGIGPECAGRRSKAA